MPDIPIRKETTIVERTNREGEREVDNPTTKVASLAVIKNPYAETWQDDLGELAELGAELGHSLTSRAVDYLDSQSAVESYGKGAIIGTNGEREHGAAVLHPKLGAAMREEVGGGDAIIPSVRKIAGPGARMDIPTHNKDDAYVLSHLDTMEVGIPDAPHDDELVVAIVVTDGGRPHPRISELV